LIKLKFWILAIPLAFTLISPAVSFVYYLSTRHLTGEQAVLHSHLRNIVAFELNPFLLFVVSYYATKRMELRYSYSVTIYFLLGSIVFPAVGSVLGIWLLVVSPFPYSLGTHIAYVARSLLGAFSQGLQTFFVSFTAIIVASMSMSPHGARF